MLRLGRRRTVSAIPSHGRQLSLREPRRHGYGAGIRCGSLRDSGMPGQAPAYDETCYPDPMRSFALFIIACGLSSCGDSEGTPSADSSSTDPATTDPAATSSSTADPGTTSLTTNDSTTASDSSTASDSTPTSSSSSSSSSDDTAGSVELEGSVYSLIEYAPDGGELYELDPMSRRDAFLMRFDFERSVVQMAACVESSDDTPFTSLCRINPDDTRWDCQCYGYAIVGDELALAEFEPGGTPPTAEFGVGLPEADLDPARTGFELTPMPAGVWGSDGESTRYLLELRSDDLFDQVFDDPDGRPGCEPC